MPAPKGRSRKGSRSASPSSKSCCWSFTRSRRGRRASGRSRRKTKRPSFASWRSSSSGSSHYPGADGRFGRREVARVAADNPIGLVRTDADAKDDIVTTNQLNLPVDRPVLVQLTSQDVIHSFGLFEMRVKQDAVPGMEIPVWFVPNRVGQYEIACSQLCGIGHFRMRGFVNIQSDADFRNFLAEEAKLLAQ